ncbi:MAG TPA: nuclear transport factor 2 family protein [Thermoleophilaceae bacterium]|jgi:ketosteroid isomerase-like protein
MSDANVEVVRRAIAAYNRRDVESLREINHADVEVDWSASRGLDAGVYTGISEVLGFFQSYFDTLDQVEIEPEEFVESGDLVVVPNVAHIRGRDGIAAVARSALVFEVHGGRVARLRLYQETHEALRAVGLSTGG